MPDPTKQQLASIIGPMLTARRNLLHSYRVLHHILQQQLIALNSQDLPRASQHNIRFLAASEVLAAQETALQSHVVRWMDAYPHIPHAARERYDDLLLDTIETLLTISAAQRRAAALQTRLTEQRLASLLAPRKEVIPSPS